MELFMTAIRYQNLGEDEAHLMLYKKDKGRRCSIPILRRVLGAI